jgi:hypothetical protein
MPNTPEVTKIYISRQDNKVHRIALPVNDVTRIGRIHKAEDDESLVQATQNLQAQGVEIHLANIDGVKRVIALERIGQKVRLTQKPQQ